MLKEQINKMKKLMLVEQDTVVQLPRYMDSTYLKTPEQAGIDEFETDRIVFDTVMDAIEHDMKLVMLRPEYVPVAKMLIDRKGYAGRVLVGTVIDFPNGDGSVTEKVREANEAIRSGADELDFVVDYKAFMNGDIDKIRREVESGTDVGLKNGKVVKWILETAALNEEQIAELTSLIRDIVVQKFGSKAQDVFVKTSTGFYQAEDDRPIGATPESVSIMKQNSGPLKVKASGGVYSADDAYKMIDAGAERIGTSAAKTILMGNKSTDNY